MDGKIIKELRLKRGMSLTELANVSGVSKSYLSFIERGKQNNPSIEVIEKLAAALKIEVHSLISWENKTDRDLLSIDKEIIDLALEMSQSQIDKAKLRQLIEILK
ncbi:transcriptional regulator with XRE-family HTH domain [Bacillus mesophilus]|uniref:Helix-turn-helix transcriptional regulator n=1 Tax=Bacillus mesophilus TaxID=1808955 RepID=A0A6M0QAF1_9BACI|nr:helix-turn-helix transcriptional regulator [Bacillus mesophilus]MBM7662664.1 transcriptional regulator with XRE-family HTH domain [Bacillus mesophilus]NEY73273.1 helix-turn-helix transcriptional regulator [Bacillus mesophilus]